MAASRSRACSASRCPATTAWSTVRSAPSCWPRSRNWSKRRCACWCEQRLRMPSEKKEVLLLGPLKPVVVSGLENACVVHKTAAATDRDAFLAEHAGVRAIACSATTERIPGSFMERFPKLEIVASFGVGYDHMDSKWAAAHGVILTNTPDVLTEEVADTALGLLLCTAREFGQAERYVRAGKWPQKNYPLSKATLRDRTVGIVG